MKEIPNGIKEYALAIAEHRVNANKDRYENRPDKRRDGMKYSEVFGEISRDLWTDAIGILGELLVQYEITTSGKYDVYACGTFISPSPSDGADIIFNNRTIGVKATEKRVMRVNLGAHKRGSVDGYIFVFVTKNEYDMKMIKKEEVDETFIRIQGAYSEYLEKRW